MRCPFCVCPRHIPVGGPWTCGFYVHLPSGSPFLLWGFGHCRSAGGLSFPPPKDGRDPPEWRFGEGHRLLWNEAAAYRICIPTSPRSPRQCFVWCEDFFPVQDCTGFGRICIIVDCVKPKQWATRAAFQEQEATATVEKGTDLWSCPSPWLCGSRWRC